MTTPDNAENKRAETIVKEITLQAIVENIPVVTAMMDEALEIAGCTPRAQMQLDIAVDELFANIAHYAYAPATGDATVRVEIAPADREARITFMDRGIPYNPLKAKEPDVSLPAEKRAIGGLGIFMVRKSMDDMRYEYRDGQNILTICKRF